MALLRKRGHCKFDDLKQSIEQQCHNRFEVLMFMNTSKMLLRHPPLGCCASSCFSVQAPLPSQENIPQFIACSACT